MMRFLLAHTARYFRSYRFSGLLELFFLLLIVWAFGATRLASFTERWLAEGTSAGLLFLSAHIFWLAAQWTLVFIVAFLLPRLPQVKALQGLPLSNRRLLGLLAVFCARYMLAFAALWLIVVWALAESEAWVAALGGLLMMPAGLLFSIVFILFGRLLFGQRQHFLFFTPALLLAAHIPFTLFYYSGSTFAAADAVVALLLAGWMLFMLPRLPQRHAEDLFPAPANRRSGFSRLALPRLFGRRVRALWQKEVLSLWRNPRYRRLKLLHLLLLLAANSWAFTLPAETQVFALTLIAATWLWLHYSHGFNEKYAHADDDIFLLTLPLRLRHLLAAKYLAELPALLLLFAVQGAFMVLASGSTVALQALIVLFIFAHFVLLIMLNFRILFHNDPRSAGYLYHFVVLFIGLMSYNYRLVGPLVALGLLIYYFDKNRRYLNH